MTILTTKTKVYIKNFIALQAQIVFEKNLGKKKTNLKMINNMHKIYI